MSDAQAVAGSTPAATQTTTPASTQQQATATSQGGAEAQGASPDVSEAIDAAEQSGEISPSEAKELKKRLKLKVDGKEIEEELDWNDDEALTRHIQKSKAFDNRAKEFTGFKSQVDTFFQQLQADPESVLEQLGFNVDEMATKRLQKKVEEMQKSPEQLEKEKMTREMEKLRKENEAVKKSQEEAQMETLRNKHAAEVENSISQALEKSKAKLPANNPKVYAMIAQNMMMAMENGYNDVTVEDIIPIVERQWKEELRGYFDSSSEDLIEELLGKSNLERLRKRRLAKRPKAADTTTPINKQVLDTGTQKPKEETPTKKMTIKEFFKS